MVIAGRTPEKLAAVAAVAAGSEGRIEVVALDVSDGAAVTATVDGVVAEHGRLDVLVNNAGVASPGTVAETSDDVMAEFGKRIPIGRPARPEEMASVIAFLAGDDAAFVTGAIVPVDGGLGASNGQPRLLS